MISAVTWVPRGAAKAVPKTAEYTEEELAAAREAANGMPLATQCCLGKQVNQAQLHLSQG